MNTQVTPSAASATISNSTPVVNNKKASTPSPQKKSRKTFTVYFAGDLWTHKDLIGNALLAEHINNKSRGRYQCVLPQDLEEPVNRTVDIRNMDLKHVMTSDMAIFNFDGANLDSGTVVEFIYAKMLDIPCVIFRSDFRSAGEGNAEQDPWNLMASHWPRSRVVKMHGMAEYQQAKRPGAFSRTINELYKKMAAEIIDALDAVRQESPLINSREDLATVFQWALKCPGTGYEDLFRSEDLASLISAKQAKGLLR